MELNSPFGSNDKLNKEQIGFFRDNDLCIQKSAAVVKMVSAQVSLPVNVETNQCSDGLYISLSA